MCRGTWYVMVPLGSKKPERLGEAMSSPRGRDVDLRKHHDRAEQRPRGTVNLLGLLVHFH